MGSIPYVGIWTNTSTAGTGFGQWQFSPTTNNGNVFYYIQTSTLNDNGGSAGNGGNDINNGGVAWGMTALNSTLANATRTFNSALTTNQTFQIDMDNGNITAGGSVGFALQNSSTQNVWQYFFTGGSNTYAIDAASVSGPALPSFTRDGMRLTFSLTSPSTYSVTVLTYAAGGLAGAGTTTTYTGSLNNPGGGQVITSVRLFNFNAGSGTNNNAYFNNMIISPGVATDNAANSGYSTAGTTFRVWAPSATAMHVSGTWNGFNTSATPLFSEGNGNWSADVAGALNGHQYQYYISNSTVGTNVTKQDPRARRVVNSASNSYIYNPTNFNWAGDNFTAPGLSNAVIYEMCIGSFNDPNAPNNAGTFYDATNRLAFLKQLGITAVEVMPINEFPGDFSWGYNPAGIFAAESAYGGPDGFKTFVKVAHQLGIAVLLDVVHNHWGGNSAGNGYGDLYHSVWQFDGTSSGGFGGIYFYQDSCRGFAQTWGPRPNFDTSQVYQFIKDNITMWMSECHVDGFRWDSVGEIEGDYPCGDTLTSGINLIADVSGMIHSQAGGKINIGEDNPNNQTGANGFDGTWDNNAFFGNVQPQLSASSDSARNMGSISFAVNINHNGGGMGNWGNVVFTEDHDQCGDGNGSGAQRIPVRIDNNNPTSYFARKRSSLGAALTLTTAGMPMLLQGQEMLTTSQFGAVIPINWGLTNTWSTIVSLYTDLIRLRRNLDGRSAGLTGVNTSTIWQDNLSKMIAYRRWNTGNVGDDVIVICNFANTNWPAYNITGFPHTGIWYTQLNSDFTKYGSDYGNFGSLSTTVSVNTATISIAPYSVLIMSQNVPGAPPTPQGVTATTIGTNQINVSWGASGGATGYIVKRGGSPIATTAATTYSDTGLSVGATYCYSVAATNNLGGTSADSVSACAATLPATSATNLLAYWTLDEGTGSTAFDSSGNTNTGAVTLGGGGWTGGMVNGALSFDGESTQVLVSNAASLNPVQTITISAWVNAQYWFNTPRIVEKGKTDNQYALFVNGSGSLEFLLTGVTGGNLSITPPSAGVWHHVAGTYDGSSISLYVDGQLAAQHPASGPLAITTDPLAIGDKPSGSVLTSFAGIIDDVRIYGSGLPANQVAQLYGTDSVGDGIANWWRLQYFGSSSTTNSSTCGACDYDGTGQNNLFKYVAGLDPTDITSVFYLQIATVTNQDAQQNLLFNPLASGRTYVPQYSTDLASGVWFPLLDYLGPSTNGNQVTITDTIAAPPQKFYRIDISVP
ncbi:MAG TPA: LamG-like jellyroll fold domain-containing protein [Verrucomicrobiae bacterium]|nr:LamG-like jellyroll fold domain-containing protein [Verrucomicrobiae bacterium]